MNVFNFCIAANLTIHTPFCVFSSFFLIFRYKRYTNYNGKKLSLNRNKSYDYDDYCRKKYLTITIFAGPKR